MTVVTSFPWRLMAPGDVPAVMALAERVHPAFYEGPAMWLDRMALFPDGCLVLPAEDGTFTLAGYALAYPAPRFSPPPLDTVLGRLSPSADALYVHDVALAPETRGRGLAAPAIRRFIGLARPFGAAMLVSVYGTAPFWERFGFRETADPRLGTKLAPYGSGAVFMLRLAGADDGAKSGTP